MRGACPPLRREHPPLVGRPARVGVAHQVECPVIALLLSMQPPSRRSPGRRRLADRDAGRLYRPVGDGGKRSGGP